MRRSVWSAGTLALLLVLTVVLGPWLAMRPAQAHVGQSADSQAVTLSVYTCCGSLAGFAPNATGPADMHTIYGHLWSLAFPHLAWTETAFSDQATLEARLASAVKAGTPPDLVFVQGGDMGNLVLRGLAQPLDPFYAHAGVSQAAFLPGMARWAYFGGHWWAIPTVSGPLGGQHIYLPEYMSQLGYDNSNLRTFDDYYQMSAKAVLFDEAGHLARIGYWPGTDTWETIGTLMCPRGHGLYSAADQPTATDPCNAAFLGYLKKLVDLYGGYDSLTTFLSRDPDFLGGNPHAYVATGKAMITPSGIAYWNLTPFDSSSFGVKGGLSYQLTPLPPTRHGTEAEVANYPSTLQEIVIPRGARHADVAFAVSKTMFWDNGYLLGRATSGSPMVRDQEHWLFELVASEGAQRKRAGLPGNPVARLEGVKMLPQLGRLSQTSNPINPVDPYYQQQLGLETVRVLRGQESPQAALRAVQQRVLAEEQRLHAEYGAWDW